jgi:hypothetical protein
MTISLLRFQILPHQFSDLTRVGMPVSLQLRIQQFPIDRKLVPASIGWDQGNRLDLRFKFMDQLRCQTDSSIGVVSDRTVYQVDFH